MKAKTPTWPHDGDHIVVAYAESASGPGWSNTPIWVVVQDGNGRLRLESIQPEEQTRDMRLLYAVSQAATSALMLAVTEALHSNP